MAADLAGRLRGVPARFVPSEMRGDLSEAEHFARYWWAAGLVDGKRVLDAGCGVGYGASILATAGALEVVGIDIAGEVLLAVRDSVHPAVRLERAEVRKLAFDDESFDVVVAFELLEHTATPAKALDELARVLRPGGLLIVSAANRDVYPAGNPHHHQELRHDELRSALADRFEHVQLFRQLDWLTSAIFDDDDLARGSGDPLEELTVRKVGTARPGGELFSVALASDAPLPEPVPLAVVGDAAQIRPWLEGLADQERHIDALNGRLDAMSTRQAELRRRLLEAQAEVVRRDEAILDHRRQLQARDEEILWLRHLAAERERQLEAMTRTRLWKAAERYRRLTRRLRR